MLLTHAKADCDGLGSMISMYLALQALGKDVIAVTNDPAPDALTFLPSINIVQNAISSKNFVITLDISKTALSKIKYKLDDDHSKINIIVTPENGHYKPEDLSFSHEQGDFDLIITFDTGNLEHLGPIYDQNSELFFKTPLINIDHHASNTDYGQVNYVDVVAASTTEVMLELFESMEKKYGKKFLNEDTATLLLAGLITDTGSFQHANTSPRSMEVAAKLLDMGARQQEIIKNIYKTKQLSTLKLWGTVLSKVESDPIYRIVWSSINKKDLEDTGASAEESEGIIDDLLSNAPGAEIIMLFKYNDEGYVSVSMRSTTNSADVGKICADNGGGGHVRAAGFKRRDGSSLEKLIDETLAKVREYQGNRLNIHPEDIKPVREESNNVEKEINMPISTAKPDNVSVDTNTNNGDKQESQTQYLDFKDERPQQSDTVSSSDQPGQTVKKEAPKPNGPKRNRSRNRNRKPRASSSEQKTVTRPEKTQNPQGGMRYAEDDHSSEK